MGRKIPTYLINLKGSKDRLQEFRMRAAKIKLDFRRVNAIDGRNAYPSATGVRLAQPGERGCALSHRKVARIFLRSGAPFCIVLEDDANPVRPLPDTAGQVRQLIREVGARRSGVDILYLQDMKQRNRVVTGGVGTYGYILSRAGARKMLFVTRGATSPIDLVIGSHFTGRVSSRTGFRAYTAWKRGAKPFVRHAPVSGSVIGKMEHQGRR